MRSSRRALGLGAWRVLKHAPSLKSPSPCEARAGRGLGRGARSIEFSRSFEIPLPASLPTSLSWGEGIDRGLGGGIKTRPSAPGSNHLGFLDELPVCQHNSST